MATVEEETVASRVYREPDASDWAVHGQPLENDELRARILDTASAIRGRLADLPAPDPDLLLGLASAEAYVERLIDAVGEALEAHPSRELIVAFREITSRHRELVQDHVRHRSGLFARVQEGLARLREVDSIDGIMERIPQEVMRLGFSRVILSQVKDSRWVPEVCLITGDEEWGREIVRVGREQEQLLDHMLLETEMVRRRAPMLVLDVQNDPRTHRPIADASYSRSYVTAPLMPDGHVIGFLHADCYMHPRHVDELDRDVLWMFAEGAGYAFERTALLDRQRALRDRLHQLTSSMNEAMDEVVDSDVELARLDKQTAVASRTAGVKVVAPESALGSLLTRREIEIARLMAAGMTNPEMARRLVISEGTVKTHVSNILRKFRSTNRAQAASRFVKLLG